MAVFSGLFIDRWENDVLKLLCNWTLSGGPFGSTGPKTFCLGLCTAAPTNDDGTGFTEVAGTGNSVSYARITYTQGTWNTPANGATSNAAQITSATASGAGWTTPIVGVGFFLATTLSTSDMIAYCPLDVAVTVTAGNQFIIPVGAMTLAVD